MKNNVINRISYIDVLRGLGIFFIVLGHTAHIGILRNYLFSFHVPLFFFASGICFKYESSVKIFLHKRLKSIIIPYLSFSVLSIILVHIAAGFGFGFEQYNNTILTDFINIIYANSKSGNLGFNTIIWFLPCYMSVAILTYFIEKFNKNFNNNSHNIIRLCSIIFLVCIGAIFFQGEKIALPWHLESAINMSVFFLLGCEFKRIQHKLINIKLNYKIIFGTIFLLIGGVFCIFNRTVGVRGNNYGNIFYFYLCAISGCLAWTLLSMAINKNKILEYLGSSSLIILVLQGFPLNFFEKVLPIAFLQENPDNFKGFMVQIAFSICVILLCLIGEKVILLLCPWMINKKRLKFGFRKGFYE